MPYIICWECDDAGQPIKNNAKSQAERAYHLDEVRDNPKLTVDTDYYLESQAGLSLAADILQYCMAATAFWKARCSVSSP